MALGEKSASKASDKSSIASSEQQAKPKPTYKHIPHSQKPPHLVAKRNARERRRVQAVNQAFYKLRKSVPIENRNKRVSKVKTLQRAIDYIRKLEQILADDDEQQARNSVSSSASIEASVQDSRSAQRGRHSIPTGDQSKQSPSRISKDTNSNCDKVQNIYKLRNRQGARNHPAQHPEHQAQLQQIAPPTHSPSSSGFAAQSSYSVASMAMSQGCSSGSLELGTGLAPGVLRGGIYQPLGDNYLTAYHTVTCADSSSQPQNQYHTYGQFHQFEPHFYPVQAVDSNSGCLTEATNFSLHNQVPPESRSICSAQLCSPQMCPNEKSEISQGGNSYRANHSRQQLPIYWSEHQHQQHHHQQQQQQQQQQQRVSTTTTTDGQPRRADSATPNMSQFKGSSPTSKESITPTHRTSFNPDSGPSPKYDVRLTTLSSSLTSLNQKLSHLQCSPAPNSSPSSSSSSSLSSSTNSSSTSNVPADSTSATLKLNGDKSNDRQAGSKDPSNGRRLAALSSCRPPQTQTTASTNKLTQGNISAADHTTSSIQVNGQATSSTCCQAYAQPEQHLIDASRPNASHLSFSATKSNNPGSSGSSGGKSNSRKNCSLINENGIPMTARIAVDTLHASADSNGSGIDNGTTISHLVYRQAHNTTTATTNNNTGTDAKRQQSSGGGRGVEVASSTNISIDHHHHNHHHHQLHHNSYQVRHLADANGPQQQLMNLEGQQVNDVCHSIKSHEASVLHDQQTQQQYHHHQTHLNLYQHNHNNYSNSAHYSTLGSDQQQSPFLNGHHQAQYDQVVGSGSTTLRSIPNGAGAGARSSPALTNVMPLSRCSLDNGI